MSMPLCLPGASWPPCGKGQEGQGGPIPLKPGASQGKRPLQGSSRGSPGQKPGYLGRSPAHVGLGSTPDPHPEACFKLPRGPFWGAGYKYVFWTLTLFKLCLHHAPGLCLWVGY